MVEAIYWIVVANFVLILGQLFVPGVSEFFQGSKLFLAPFISFGVLGGLLVFYTLKEKVKGRLRKFLLLTGISAGGFLAGAVLHNFFYALAILAERIFVLHYMMEGLQVVFFLMAVLVCPVGVLIGLVGSGWLMRKR